ncbi:MAG TPA: carboxypeptidase regulatory-like domain-containing protein [Candidatus Acidoferrales bacterium]|nr:carboxypeptidase regulatory-like domain-containing protein [Candidatus Acidoferrales bacterium]
MKTRYLHLVLAATVVLLFTACGNKQGSESPAPAATVDITTAGSITGTVTLEGAPPTFKPIDMSASPACAAANPSPVVPPIMVVGDNGALANVVIFVKDGLSNYRFDTPSDPAILGQKNCMYEPHVSALMTNQPFQIQNNDPTMHNVHPLPKHNRQWSTSQPAGSAALKSAFARPEFAMPVLCNVHPWMRAYVFVFDHPYFAVTSKTGKFELRNLPPGTYTIEAWHENYAAQDQAVTIGPRESKAISFTFKPAGTADN